MNVIQYSFPQFIDDVIFNFHSFNNFKLIKQSNQQIYCLNLFCLNLYYKSLTKLKQMEGYCVKCKAKREIKSANEVTMKNGRKAMKGECPSCGTGMFRILGKA